VSSGPALVSGTWSHQWIYRTPRGDLHLFTSKDGAIKVAESVGGIVQIEGAPALVGFDGAIGI